MGLNKIISWFTGYLELLVRGSQLEKLINLLTGSGLYLWDVSRLGPDVLRLKLRAHGFFRIREIIKKSGCQVRIHRKKGWPFLKRRMLRRKGFFVGAILFVAGIIYLSTFVWFIKVEGFSGTERDKLLAVMAKTGLRRGVLRQEIIAKKRFIEREVMMETPQAVWLGITVRGVLAEVKVVPRKSVPPPQGAADVVAARDGVVSKIAVIRGVPVVKEGQTVARGEMLISGTEWYNEIQTGVLHKKDVVASGIIEARVWHDVEVIEPKTVWQPQLTKDQYFVYKLRWGKRLWTLFGWGSRQNLPYLLTRGRKRVYQGRNPAEVVEIIKDTYQVVNWVKVKRSDAEIKRSALARAKAAQKLLAVATANRIITWVDEGNFLKLLLTFETTQDIAATITR